ncbi:MAG: MEMAR_RS02690 family S-layer glycoprotein [Methanocorpusculum sp.]|nr:MEMAR_RS02690 family S-layer glycoprotein [Methanocorpusculum sp.]MDE2524390.1 MEMAR_RS02690 family S-layer glycoprotein [Methanocorpusculum sp.]
MKNTKIMAALAIFLISALCIGAVSAINVADSQTIASSDVMTSGNSYVLNFSSDFDPTGNLTSGSYYLNNTAIKQPITFTRIGGTETIPVTSDAKVDLTDTVAGTYKATVTFADVFYDLNVTDTVTGAAGRFAVKNGHQVANITPNVGYALIYPNGKPVSVGVTFENTTAGKKYTATVDDRGYLGIVTAATPDNPNGIYTYKATGLTADFYIKVNPKGSSVGYDGYRPVDATKNQTAFVFEKINVTAGSTDPVLTLYSSGANPQVINSISGTVVDDKLYFYLTESSVGKNYGKYVVGNDASGANGIVYIWYPEISLEGRLAQNGVALSDSIDGQTVNRETPITFLINSPQVASAFLNTTKDGVVNQAAAAKVVFTTPAGGKTTSFGDGDYSTVQLTGTQTQSDASASGENAPAGTYTAQAEYITFELLDKTAYSVFADYAAKSNTVSFTLQSSTLTITAAKDSVVRSNPFTVTISGNSNTNYVVYLESANLNEINPILQKSQSGFQGYVETLKTVSGGETTVGLESSGVFETDASGKRNIQYNTGADTEDKTYTVKVNALAEPYTKGADIAVIDTSDYDKVKVKVEKGAVTISASGDGAYYIGEEIKLTGTNTDSTNVFLFVTGQNLDFNDGIVLKALPTQKMAAYATSPVSVKTDNTWEYKWDTSRVSLDAGSYTIYATSLLTNGKSSGALEVTGKESEKYGSQIDGQNGKWAVKLSDSEYATVSISLKKPFLSAVPSGSTVAKGDNLYIRGTAEGDPNSLNIYIFGTNLFMSESVTVEDNGSYDKKIEIPSTMSSGQYFVVIEHPMMNGIFDVKLSGKDGNGAQYFYIENVGTGGTGDQSSFYVTGGDRLQGSQAADALTKMIDSSNIDDIYTKLTFNVNDPWIRVNTPGDQAVGTKFTITGTTNLAIDDQVIVEVVSSSFQAADKTQDLGNSGVTQTAKVVAGEGTDNVWSVEVDTTNWKLDEYAIKVDGIEVDVSTTTNFNLVEKLPDTPKPTETGTQATTTATATATTTPTQTPGFGAFIALAGLGAVALLVLRRN